MNTAGDTRNRLASFFACSLLIRRRPDRISDTRPREPRISARSICRNPCESIRKPESALRRALRNRVGSRFKALDQAGDQPKQRVLFRRQVILTLFHQGLYEFQCDFILGLCLDHLWHDPGQQASGELDIQAVRGRERAARVLTPAESLKGFRTPEPFRSV